MSYLESKTVPTPGLSGPRHGAFVKLDSGTYFYVVTELSNEIIGWKVAYNSNGLDLDFGKELFIIPTHGPGSTGIGNTTRASELVISVSSSYYHAPTVDQPYTNQFTRYA